MASRKCLKGVVDNFLGTFTSRNSDKDGFWIFGQYFDEIEDYYADLLDQTGINERFTRLARNRFRDQLCKASIHRGWVIKADLTIKKISKNPIPGKVNGKLVEGANFKVTVSVVTDNDLYISSCKRLFIAKHNPRIELKSLSIGR